VAAQSSHAACPHFGCRTSDLRVEPGAEGESEIRSKKSEVAFMRRRAASGARFQPPGA